MIDEDAKSFLIDRGFGQPHPLGSAPEPLDEIFDSPYRLCDLVSQGRERHDHVVVGLGKGVAVPRTLLDAQHVCVENSPICIRTLLFEPGEKRRAEIEANVFVVVHHASQTALLV